MSLCHLDWASGLTQSKSSREAMTAELFRPHYLNSTIALHYPYWRELNSFFLFEI